MPWEMVNPSRSGLVAAGGGLGPLRASGGTGPTIGPSNFPFEFSVSFTFQHLAGVPPSPIVFCSVSNTLNPKP